MEFIDLTEDHSEDELVFLGITAKIESIMMRECHPMMSATI